MSRVLWEQIDWPGSLFMSWAKCSYPVGRCPRAGCAGSNQRSPRDTLSRGQSNDHSCGWLIIGNGAASGRGPSDLVRPVTAGSMGGHFISSCGESNDPSSATLTSWLRVLAPDLANRRWTIFLTELSEIPRLSPIFLLERPSMMPSSTFRSRSSSGSPRLSSPASRQGGYRSISWSARS